MVHPQRRQRRASSESSSSSSSSDSSASSRSSDATGRTGATAVPAKNAAERATTEPSAPRPWRFLDTEETCHFFNTEIVVSTNDVRRVDMEDASDIESSDDDDDDEDDDDDDDDGETEQAEPEAEEVAADALEQAVVHVDDAPRVLNPMQTAYEDIFGDFDDLYFPGIAKNAPNKLRLRRRTQHQEAAQVLSSFCKDLQTGNNYLFRKRSEFLRVCFQRALDLDREHDTKESAEVAKLASADSPGVQDPLVFQFQCSRLERPIDVTIPELHPRKWPHLPHRDPREWSNDLSAIIIFAQRVTELPEGSLLYEPIDTRVFVERCCDVLKQKSIDVWSAELSHTPEPTETAVAVLVAMLSVAVRLQSFSLLLLVAETAVRVGKSTSIAQCRWGKELDAIVADCLQTLDRFLHKEAPPATYPRALLSQWKLCAYQPSTSDAIATDGVFLYVYGRSGLLKIGTGRGSTMRDFVYEHNKRYCRSRDAERSWLCLIGDYLYCRNIVMPSSRVDRISTKNLREVEELFFAPASKVPEQPTGSTGGTVYAMVTDGVDLLTVHSVDTQKIGEKKRIRSSRMKRASSSEAAKALAAKSARRSTNAASSEPSGGIQVGDRVVRGPDWKWGAQDGEKGCPGSVERISTWGGVKGCGVTVRWDKNQRVNTYRWGAEGCYDIVVVVEKPGGILVKKPLPDKAAGTSTSNEPVTPRHRFVVTRFGVSTLLSVVDLDREVTDSFLGISPKSDAAAEKTEEDNKFLLTAVHEHTLGVSSSTTAWMCDGGTAGCLGDNSGVRYRCERGCDFDLCEVCLTGTLIGKQPDLQTPVTVVGVQASSSSVDGKPMEEEAAEATAGEQTHTPQASLPDDSEEPTPEEREATQVDDLFAFWCGLYSRRECEIALRRASHSTEDAVAWMSVSGDDLKKALILPYIESFMLESPANSSGLDPVLLVAGSFYAVDGQLCIVSPPGLYQGEKPKRSIHAADAAWFFSLKDGSLRDSKGSPTLLKSVPAGSPICTDISRRRILVFSGYLNCVEEYCVTTEGSNSTSEVRATVNSDLRTIGLRIYTFIRKAIDQRWAWRAFKKPMQGLQDWINQLQQESAITAAACIRENVKSDSTAAKARTRQIRKLRLRVEEFEKFECSEDRGYYVPYCVDFSKLGVRGLLIALNRALQGLEVFGKDACLCLRQVTGIWRGFLGDCIASDVVLQLPEEWSSLVRSVVHGLEKVIFGQVNDDVGEFLEDPLVSVIVLACQDILLWGIDVGLFEGFDRCDLLVTCLTDLLADPVDSLPPNYFILMHDSTGEVQVHSTQDCSISFIRRVLALNTEATDGGIAALIYERSQVEDLIKLLFKLSARESAAQIGTSHRQEVSGERVYSPVEKGLLALFNGCSIDLLACADASAGSTSRRRRLSSVISEESIFHTFAISCLQTCEELVLLVGDRGRKADDEILSRSVCGKLLPLVLAMACNGGRATLTVLKDPLLRLASLLSSPSPVVKSSRFTSTTTIIESSHPYSRNQGALRKVVRIPGASCLHIEFDSRCSTTGEADFVFVTPGHAWFHSDRVPFGENGIGDAGGCFFGSRHTGNWPHHGGGISVWGDTATIMLCSTSQERQGASADDDGRRWGLKCQVRGVYLGAAVSWRNDAFSATEHALSVLVQRQLSLCERTLEHPLLMKAIFPITAIRDLQSIRNADHENLVREVIEATEEESCGTSLVQFYESKLLAQTRRQSPGTQTPSWRKALRLVLGTLIAFGKTSVSELMTQDSVTSKSILRTMSAVETWMIRRVQLLKECQFLQEDEAPPAQLIERLSTDVFRLKELCAMKDVSFFESDPKQSATELFRVISLERASVATRDLHDEVAREIVEKVQYALKYSMPTSSAERPCVMMNSKASSTLVLDYLTSAVSSDDVRHADGCLTSAIGYASNALDLVLSMQRRTDKCGITPQSPSTIGNVGSCWSDHVAEQRRLALPPDALIESHRISTWASQVSQCIRDSGLPFSMRVAAMTDLITVCATFRAHIRALTLREYIAATSDLILDLEQGNVSAWSDRDPESPTLEELAWIGYRYGIDAMFADGDHEGAVTALRTMVGRLVSIGAASLELVSSVQSKSIDRVMKIGSAHVESITQSPSVAATWLELCVAQIRGQDYGSTTSVCVASVRTIFAMGQFSSATLESSVIRSVLEDPELLDRLLERIGILQSSIKLTGDENENKLKDCCVIILENDKSKSKIIDALETVDCETSNLVCLPKTLSQLDTSDDPQQAPIINVEGGGSDTVHRNVRCDGCNQSPIHGFRFKCFTCANYDLCGSCYANQCMHSLDHQFARLASPSGAGELLQPRSKVNGAVVPEASLVGSKQWMASVMRALLETYGYGVMCRGSSEDCLRRAKELAGAGFAVTVMEWPDVKDLEDYYDWKSIVEAVLEPGSARLSRRSSSAASPSTTIRKVDRCVLRQFNGKMRRATCRHELVDPSFLLAELVGFTRYLVNRSEIQACMVPLVSQIMEGIKRLGTEVPLLTAADRALFHRTLGLTNVLGGFVETLRLGARVMTNDLEANKNRFGIVKQCADTRENVVVMWYPRHGLSDDEVDLESHHSPVHLNIVAEVDVVSVHPEVSASTSFFPAFASVLKSAHKLLKRTAHDLVQNPGHVAATELIVGWLRMFMTSMESLPSLLDSQTSLGNGSGNMALLLFQLAKTSKSGASFQSLEGTRSVAWCAQQVMLNDCQFKLASRPIVSADVGQDSSCVFGPGANGQTDLTDYVFNLYAHSSRSELPQHSGRNKLLEYWEKNVIPAIESYVAGSFKSYEMDYFFAQLREPLREGNPAAAMKIAFTLCDGHVPSGCHYPDPDTDWSALQLDDIEIGARYIISGGLTSSEQSDWPLEMQWTVGHTGVVRTVCPSGLVLMQLWNPRTSCLENWWFQVENLSTSSAAVNSSERSVDSYEHALADLVKIDLELLGVIARKCVFSMLRHSPDQFPLVSDRQATKTHFNIVDILRMAAGAELGFEAKTIAGEADVGGRGIVSVGNVNGAKPVYDLMESLRFVLTKRFEHVPAAGQDAVQDEHKPLSPMNQAHKTKLAKSGKLSGSTSLSPLKTPGQQATPSGEVVVSKYRFTLIEALVQELKRALESCASFSQQSAFTVSSDSPPKPLIVLKVPGASCMVISFAVHPVLMDLPAGSSLEFFRDERCTSRIFGFFGDKRGLNFLPPLVVEGDKCFVRASQAAYARYKFRVDPLTSDFGLAMWIGEELYQRMTSVTLASFELESILSSALNSITDYVTSGAISLPPCIKGVMCQLLTKVVNFAINHSMSNSVPLSKLSALTRDLAVAYDHELSAQKGLFSLPTQQLGELLATIEEVSRLRGTTSISITAAWWPNLVRFATFTRILTYKQVSATSSDLLTRISCGRTPVDAVDEATRMLQEHDFLCERMILLQKVPRTKRLTELEVALSRFIQHLALEECGEADDQTVLSATEVVRSGVLGKVMHMPVDSNGETVGYAVVDVGRHDIISRLLLRLQKESFEFDGSATEEDLELSNKLDGLNEAVPTETDNEGGDIAPAVSDDTVWSCGVCTLENPAFEVECAACGSPMPIHASSGTSRRQRAQSTRPRNATSQDQGAVSEAREEGNSSGWSCEACTLVNPWATVECAACRSERNPSLVEPPRDSGGDSTNASADDAPESKTSRHDLRGINLSDLLNVAVNQNVKQVTTFLIEQLTVGGRELHRQLVRLIDRELASKSTQAPSDVDGFVVKAAKHCGVDDPSIARRQQFHSALLDVAAQEPIRVYQWLRESGHDLNAETNHYTSVEAARASQARWTHQMDIQLVVLARQVGSRIGILSLMDMCPSHLCSSQAAEGSLLSGLESRDIRLRFALLKTLNKLSLEVLPMVNLRNQTDPNAFRTRLVAIRQLLFPAVKIRFFADAQDKANMAQSNLTDAAVKRPVVTLDRRRISGSRQPGEPLSLRDPKKSLFAATMTQLSRVKPSILRAKRPTGASDPFVAFIVVFSGENVVGEGGPYRQLFNDIASELLSEGNPLFVPTQNSSMKIGEYRDRFLPKPSSTTRAMLKMFEFVGVLMGGCIRTGVRLNLRLAPIIWKMLVKQSLTTVDLEHIDFSVCESLKFIETAASAESADPTSDTDVYFDSFTTALSDGSIVELKPGGLNEPVTKSSCKEYVSLVKAARFQECKPQVDAMLRGIGMIVPIHLLQLCTWLELQQWVCGSLAVDVNLLKRHTLYSSGMTPDKFPHLEMFWRVLDSFTEENKRRFINFAWGQDTLPADDAEFDRTHTRLLIKTPPVTAANQDSLLPKADTCFFNLELPAYSSEDIMREKLLLAITMCTSMDGDEQTGRMDLYFSTDALDDAHIE